MKVSIKLSAKERVDNDGAIFMEYNNTATSYTKHVDIRYKYDNKYVEDGIVKLVFINSADNDSNNLMKIIGGKLHAKYASMMTDKIS